MPQARPQLDWARPQWDGDNLASPRFDDLYRSAQGARDEAQQVFVDACGLPERFARPGHTLLGELGVGAGVSTLAALRTFDRHAHPQARLHAVSIEKHPLRPDDFAAALAGYAQADPGAADLVKTLAHAYRQALAPHWLRHGDRVRFALLGGRASLTLILDDAAAALEGLSDPDARMPGADPGGPGFDAWFLDGFAPARNPDMWSPAVLNSVAKLTKPGGVAATYASASAVREGLAANGFDVQRLPGFGRKKHRIVATRRTQHASPETPRIETAVVVGAGLAGCATARTLAEAGVAVTLLDRAGVAAGGSGNPWGVMQPKVAAEVTPAVRFTRAGCAVTERWLAKLDAEAANWARKTGALHVAGDDKAATRWQKAASPDIAAGRWVDRAEAAQRAGLDVGLPGLWVDDAWLVSPKSLCAALVDHPGVEVRLAEVASIEPRSASDDPRRVHLATGEALDTGAVVVAAAHQAGKITGIDPAALPLTPVRGQTTAVHATEASRNLRCPIHYRGYALPVDLDAHGQHWLGSTYGHGDPDPSHRPAEDLENVAKLAERCPALAQAMRLDAASPAPPQVAGGRAAVRAVTPDRLPHCGTLMPGVWCSLGHASHGLATAVLCGELLADAITGRPQGVAPDIAGLCHVARFA
ncbi:MAG: FAD-dependent 5-carboxymethylaminomethyl-2-thiouridine(34) oxidoreductase MnmC [Planctomycetota bacterium]